MAEFQIATTFILTKSETKDERFEHSTSMLYSMGVADLIDFFQQMRGNLNRVFIIIFIKPRKQSSS